MIRKIATRTDFGKRVTPQASLALDASNFFLADVRDALGPYLAVYLLTERNWDAANIGIVMSIATIAGILAQTPAGAVVDATKAKRAFMVCAALLVTGASLLVPWLSAFWPVAISQATAHAAGVVFGPALAAVTLGIVGNRAFTNRIGRNESFNHAGNAFAATAAGVLAYVWGPKVVFYLLASMAVASIISVLAIPERSIDHDLARGLHRELSTAGSDHPSGVRVLLTCRPLLIFAGCAITFHFANAAMLPLVGQKLALQDKNLGTTLMSACIVAAQIVMVPMAMLVGAKADLWGRKPLFLIALSVLAIRGCLYPLSDNPFWLVGVQLLDGVGAGIYGALFPVIVADLMRGTGRFNVAQGAIITAQGIGAALSTALAGVIVVHAGYGAAFLALSAVAVAGLALYYLVMPETREAETIKASSKQALTAR
ncbi:MAG: MFS transporter [Hyphomicrobiales bacterium]|nr:MFS transporter [Hyphomicrobiales bacterium]